MKRIWIAGAIIIAIVMICVGEQIYITATTSTIDKLVDNAMQDSAAINDIKEYWESRNDVLFAISNHESLDQLSVAIDQLSTDSDEPQRDLSQVRSANSAYYENQRAIFSNIL